ncbi:DUF1844 domain-containing protein [Tunturiibacter gelidoferens]|uniref:DUF1844 domain-containing protein n=2 Tax=Tunturiibacter TaxID=3154218 RepID=A0A7Y9NPI9_9BACT|nr:DUF1844 domain-containing protein [Edaphobacter lichenicola]MBB5341815.1 hypothetical protein [Edaphobacter lichenicola]NYF53191.1 hypothetical protein [Edaphobacter lichenicola]
MPEQNKPFVVTDRRKFTMDGELRPDADPSPEREERESRSSEPAAAAPPPPAAPETPQEPELPPALTAEQTEQAKRAYEMTADRLDTAIRSANPGMDHPPAMSFDQLVQSVYMTSIMQLGGTTQEGQQPQVDILGARQSIDMLQVLEDKTKGNLSPEETRLLESALFELRMAFLEVTQALARSAAAKAPGGAGRPGPAGPSIVR